MFRITKYVVLTATILLLTIIFRFSAQKGAESSGVSGKVADWVAGSFDKLGNLELSSAEHQQFISWISAPVRKLGHLSEYALLGFLLYFDLYFFFPGIKKQKGKWFLLAIVGAVIFASLDEIHQLFVPGRNGNIIDVCIDTFGAVIGIAGANFLYDTASAVRAHLQFRTGSKKPEKGAGRSV